MKLLNGKDISEFIKTRQAAVVANIRQHQNILPKLAIIKVKDDPVINTYVRLKQRYGKDIGVEVDTYTPQQSEVPKLLNKLNKDESVHGIIIQLPLNDISETEKIVNLVNHEKDVDALSLNSDYPPATPTAILWLLAGHNVELLGKKVLLIGRGKLVGQPLSKMLKDSGVDVTIADRSTKDLKQLALESDVIITAAGSPAIIFPDMIKNNAVVVDAGVASEDGKTVGDVDKSVYEREDITITPVKGGVGPLTVTSLFENVIQAANKAANHK